MRGSKTLTIQTPSGDEVIASASYIPCSRRPSIPIRRIQRAEPQVLDRESESRSLLDQRPKMECEPPPQVEPRNIAMAAVSENDVGRREEDLLRGPVVVDLDQESVEQGQMCNGRATYIQCHLDRAGLVAQEFVARLNHVTTEEQEVLELDATRTGLAIANGAEVDEYGVVRGRTAVFAVGDNLTRIYDTLAGSLDVAVRLALRTFGGGRRGILVVAPTFEESDEEVRVSDALRRRIPAEGLYMKRMRA